MIHEIRREVIAGRLGDDWGLREHLIAALRSHGATVTLHEDGTVVFRGPWLVPGWDVLAPVSRGEVSVEPGIPGSCRVQYRLSLFRVRIACAMFTLVVLLFLGLAKLPVYFVLCHLRYMGVAVRYERGAHLCSVSHSHRENDR